jgi:iron(III) transport system substrate-binding protein
MKLDRRTLLQGASALGAASLLPSRGLAAETVVVYSAISTKVMQAFVEGFKKKQPDIGIQVISGGSGELLSRMKAERNNPRGDILAGPDTDVFDGAIDLFAPYQSTEAAAFDAAAHHPEGKYYGFSTNFQVMIINTKMMPLEQAPKSWADLATPALKGKFIMANPAQSGSAFSQLHQIVGLHGWDVMDKIILNATFVSSSKLAFQNIAKGEFPIGLTSEFNVVQSKEEGFPVAAVYPADGTALINDANGLIKGGPNPVVAQKFLDYVNSREGHEILVSVDKRRSARKDVAPPPGLPPIASIKAIPYDSAGAAKNHDTEIERFDKTFSRK